ncbi:MAG: hypothetical protein QM811_07005 [Pirellulales bacterium]
MKPGRYLAGVTSLGDKVFRELTHSSLGQYVAGTKRLIQKGYAPPFILEHAPPGSPDGGPVLGWDKKADLLRNGAGWVTDVFQNKDGSIGYELDVRDPNIESKLKDGSIKFTSPELRTKPFPSGDGETIAGGYIAHVAATYKPRNIEQSASEAIAMSVDAMQFSLDDLDDEEKDKKDKDDEKVELEATDKDGDGEIDAGEVKVEGEGGQAPQIDGTITISLDPSVYHSVIGMMKAKGVALPDDLVPEMLFPALLAEMSKVPGVESKESKVVEESPPVQYSIGDCDGDRLPKLLVKAIRSESDKAKGQINALRIPALQKKLAELAGAMQFSADAEELPSLTVTQVVGLLSETIPEGLRAMFANGEQFSVTEHHDPGYLDGGEIKTAEQAKAFVDKQAEHIPLLRK